MRTELSLLEQLDALVRNGTLSAASEELHLTQPTLTRSMQKLEQQIGFPLFIRGNNRIRLNENGLLAADYAKRILAMETEMKNTIYLREKSRNTVFFGANAPAPIREIVPQLSELAHGKTISSEVKCDEELLKGLKEDRYQLISLNYPVNDKYFFCSKLFGERIYYCYKPAEHPVRRDGVFFSDINGRDILMLDGVGFWKSRIKQQLPDSRIILQEDNEKVNLLAEYSNLPAFSSDVVIRHNIIRPKRIPVPILDDAAYADHYCICKAANKEMVTIVTQIAQRYTAASEHSS